MDYINLMIIKELIMDLEQSVDDDEINSFVDLYLSLTADLKKIATRNGRTAHETLLDLMVIKLNQRRDDAQSL